jgi:hypothetical protein
MVELFEAKVLQYIRYILQNAFMVSIKYWTDNLLQITNNEYRQ